IDQAVGSTMDEDIDGEARPQRQAPDIGADEAMASPLVLEASRIESGSLALSWHLAPSMLVYLDRYELRVSAEAGAAPPREGGLETPIDVGQETGFILTGLTDGKEYVIYLVAYDASGTAFADSSVAASPARVFRTFLPLALGH
ncbi:MAG: fibronectin type III domain-containing protein, partial [Anaerolineae bacterium]